MKKIIALALTIVMIFGILAVAPVSVGASSSDWKYAYKNEINTIKSYYPNACYWLINFDNNGIPELVIDTRVVIGGSYLVTYNGSVKKYSLGGGNSVLYKNGNLLYSSSFSIGSGVCSFYVTRINSSVTRIFDGFYSTNVGRETNPENFKYYIKQSNTNKQVSRSNFYNELNSCFNMNTSTNLYKQTYYNSSQAISVINNFIETPVITEVSYSSGKITVKWDKGDDYGAQKYQVARIRTGESSYTYFTVTNNSFTETNVTPNTTYTYQVRKYNYATQTYGKWSSSRSVTTKSGGKSGKTGNCNWSLSNGTLTITGNGAMGDITDYVYHADTDTYTYNLPWGKDIKKVIIGNGVTRIGTASFHYCKSLSSVSLPSSLKEIGDKAFNGCSGLTSITIPNNVTKIGQRAFRSCTGLTSVTIGSSVKTIGETAFYYCKNLKSLTIPKSVTQISKMAFGYFSEVKKIENFKLYGYKGTVAQTYAKANGFTFVEIPDSTVVKPAAPTLSVSNTTGGLKASWNKVANAVSYIMYYRSINATSWSSLSTSNTSYNVPNAKSGTLYYVQVQSVGKNNVKGNCSAVKSMTYIARTTITGLNYNGNNTLTWSKISGANNYQVARIKKGESSYTYFYTSNTSLTERNATGGTSYTYQVRAMYQTANNGTAYGAWSAGKTVVTLVAPTVKLAKYSGGFKATWNSIRGTVKYVVYYKKSTDSGWSSTETKNLYCNFSSAKKGATYYVQIRPVGNGVYGPYSKVNSIVV